MFGFLRLAITACALCLLVWVAVSVPLGKHTLWGHLTRIWATEEAQDLAHGAKEAAGPTVERVKRGVQAGVREAAESK